MLLKYVYYIQQKASKRLYYLRELRRSGVPQSELCKVYTTLIRPVLEYACPVWSTSLSQELKQILESVQQRACRIMLPRLSYPEALEHFDLESLEDRRFALCTKFFQEMKDSRHRLHHLLPQPTTNLYNLRNKLEFPLPLCKTNRYKDSYVPWCLFNVQ